MLLRDHGSDCLSRSGLIPEEYDEDTVGGWAEYWFDAIMPGNYYKLSQDMTLARLYQTAVTPVMGAAALWYMGHISSMTGQGSTLIRAMTTKAARIRSMYLFLSSNSVIVTPALALTASAVVSHEIGEVISELPGHSGTNSQTNVSNIWSGGGSMSGGVMPSVPYDSRNHDRQGQADMSEVFTWEYWGL